MAHYHNDHQTPVSSHNDQGSSPVSDSRTSKHRSFEVSLDAFEPHYRMTQCSGEGGFGAVYEASGPNEQKFAIKIQSTRALRQSSLFHELAIYEKLITDPHPTLGTPQIHDYFEVGDLQFLVMERMGCSLHGIVERSGLISKKDALMLGIQLVRRLEAIHRAGVVHRDIKPPNILIALGTSKRIVLLIDFGLATIVDDCDEYNIDGEVAFVGPDYFASVEALFRKKPTRPGDLQSLAFTLLCLVVGRLPWNTTAKGRKGV